MALILPSVRFEHGPLQPELGTLPKRHLYDYDIELPSEFTKQRTEKYQTVTLYIGQKQVTKMSQGNKKTKGSKKSTGNGERLYVLVMSRTRFRVNPHSIVA